MQLFTILPLLTSRSVCCVAQKYIINSAFALKTALGSHYKELL